MSQRSLSVSINHVRQLMENLIQNAVEHGGNGVTVTIGDLADGLYVADSGPGIPEDKYDQIFERGYTTTDSGLGFGLAIVEEIVEAHDWDITTTENSTGGARFEITGVEVAENLGT